MPIWEWLADAAGLLLIPLIIYAVALVVRRRWVTRNGGTFELSYRPRPEGLAERSRGRGWVLGLGRYSGDTLEFFRIFSVLPRPMVVLDRADLRYTGQRQPERSEMHALYAGHVIVSCSTSHTGLELAMSADAVTGLRSWLEAAPPGRGILPV
jgi:hypothetical protein